MLAPMSDLLRWCLEAHPDRSHRAGPLVFVDLPLAVEVIDRAESAGISVDGVRGFSVSDGVATPIPEQQLDPDGLELLDCETPSGATCGAARRVLRGRWAEAAPTVGRHMVLLEFDDRS